MNRAASFALRCGLLAGIIAGGPLPVPHSQAIPNQINFGGFFNRAGMLFEDFAALAETWRPGSPLKGAWERSRPAPGADPSVERLRLADSALLFGLPAREVTAERIDGRTKRFEAIFEPPSGTSLGQWERTLRGNLAAWADAEKDSRYRRGAAIVVVTPRPTSGDLAVTFTSREAAAATSP